MTFFDGGITVGNYYSPSQQDQYWIRYGAGGMVTLVPPAPLIHYAWVTSNQNINSASNSLNPALAINTHSSTVSPLDASSTNPGYAIYRKCFCLAPNAQNVRMNFRITGDDAVQVWLNNMSTQVLSPGNFYTSVRTVSNFTSGFQRGQRNCVYILVEDNLGGNAWMKLKGTLTATSGLWDSAATGLGNAAALQTSYPNYSGCKCDFQNVGIGNAGPAATVQDAKTMRMADGPDDQETLDAIVKYAEERRAARMAGQKLDVGKPKK